MAEYKLPEPVVIDTHIESGYQIRGYTAATLRTEIAAAEKRGREEMREKCAKECEYKHKEFGNGHDYAAAIRSIE